MFGRGAVRWLGASGGGFLASARKSIRSSLKEALRCLLPQTQPPSLRILPARLHGAREMFRREYG